jgi:hypothetical protein
MAIHASWQIQARIEKKSVLVFANILVTEVEQHYAMPDIGWMTMSFKHPVM